MRFSVVSIIALLAAGVGTQAFTTPQYASMIQRGYVQGASRRPTTVAFLSDNTMRSNEQDGQDIQSTVPSSSNTFVSMLSPIAAMTAVAFFFPDVASAAGPDWGIFEGRTGSLLHPIMMGSLLLYSGYTAFLGFQWRRQRTMGDEISSLKKSLPDLKGAASISEALAAAKEAGDAARVSALEAAVSTEQQINDLQAERKSLAAANPREQHFSQGALIAFLGTAFAIEGPLNTYARAGKLFPGPHLYVGAGLVVLWALAVATIPSMQKGNDTARTIHIGANLTGLGLFGWQVVSGIPILLKVIEKTSWP